MPNDKKVLIAYYSLSGNTKDVAEAIRSKTGGDIFRIETVQSYPEEYRATTAQAKREINEGFRPELKGKIDNIAQYDIIFIGSPNWWGTIAPAVSSFLADYDLKGKTVIPFITHGGRRCPKYNYRFNCPMQWLLSQTKRLGRLWQPNIGRFRLA